MNAPATIGHNSDAFTVARDTVQDAVDEARQWLDGAAVTSQEQADGLAGLLDLLRKAHKTAEEARAAEIAPINLAWDEVNNRYKPLLADPKRAMDTVKAVLKKWQAEQKRLADEAAAAARAAAEQAAREAQEAMRAADAANLAEREAAERALAEAERLAREAKRAEEAPVGAKGAFAARRTALIVTREPVEIVNGKAALQWATRHVADDLRAWLLQTAKRHGGRDVPGVRYEERETVR